MRSAIINLDKPSGITSQQAVSRAKKILGTGKAGHCGTLDPQASGVLLICLGRATRLADYFQALPKTYRAVLKLGEVTDTQDATGTVTASADASGLSDDEVTATLKSFVGRIAQVPPMYSALKSSGTPLHRLARKGIEIPRAPRPVDIYDIRILSIEHPLVTFDVSCSKGTYIRTLCHDVGQSLGPGAHLLSLIRRAVGDFRIEKAVTLERLDEQYLIAPEAALSFMAECRIREPAATRLRNGIRAPEEQCIFSEKEEPGKRYRLHTEDGEFLGVGLLKDGQVAVECLIAA